MIPIAQFFSTPVPQWLWEKEACVSWPHLFPSVWNTAWIFLIKLTRFLLPLEPLALPGSKGTE